MDTGDANKSHTNTKRCAGISGKFETQFVPCTATPTTPGAYVRNRLFILGIEPLDLSLELKKLGIKISAHTFRRSRLWNVSASEWFIICSVLKISADGFQHQSCRECLLHDLSEKTGETSIRSKTKKSLWRSLTISAKYKFNLKAKDLCKAF